MKDVYEQLRERLDDMAVGFPATASGVEMRILKKIFTESQAELFVKLRPVPESPQDIAQRLRMDADALADRLEEMAKKGLLFRVRKGESVRYAAVPYVVGIFEFQLNHMDAEFARDHEEYFETAFGKNIQGFQTPVLRTVPIDRELVAEYPVAPFEDVLEILENQKTIAVSPCVCRTTKDLVGEPCDKPLGNCFSFGSHAAYYVENGMGRYISIDEAKEIVTANEKAGLVMQPFNAQKAGGMCSCCGCCCGVLRSIKSQPVPVDAVKSNYYAVVDADECTGCETCMDRCQMDAIAMVDDVAELNLDRCIGCGLCITTCPVEALSLVKKDEDHQYAPPKSGGETYIRIASERGKLEKLMQ
ncbi:MAG: 4Fe-4S binding protein [Deltaproteobacteria bacterium]|jgi:ferredoxin|nr:4Fe-4S binding protein [Deltaproteobacteria bacterium]